MYVFFGGDNWNKNSLSNEVKGEVKHQTVNQYVYISM